MKLPTKYTNEKDPKVRRQFTGRLTYKDHAKIVEISKERDLPPWRIIEEAILEYLERYEAIKNQIKEEEENESKRN